jgi:hypothetical protein
MPESEAIALYEQQHAILATMREGVASDVRRGPAASDTGGTFDRAHGVAYSLDDLALLSLLSDSTHQKVDRLMASMGTFLAVDDQSTQMFWKRRAELAPWVAQRLKEIGEP